MEFDRSDYDNYNKDFKNYVDSLYKEQENSEKLFACQNLIILPEKVVVYVGQSQNTVFEKGAFLCRTGAFFGIGRARCRILSWVTQNEAGNLELLCAFSQSKFEVKVESFKYREPFSDVPF